MIYSIDILYLNVCTGNYDNLRTGLSNLSVPIHLSEVLMGEVWQHPLLLVHYTSLLVECGSIGLPQHIAL